MGPGRRSSSNPSSRLRMSLWACAGVFALRAAPWTSEFISTNRSSQSTRDAFCVLLRASTEGRVDPLVEVVDAHGDLCVSGGRGARPPS